MDETKKNWAELKKQRILNFDKEHDSYHVWKGQ